MRAFLSGLSECGHFCVTRGSAMGFLNSLTELDHKRTLALVDTLPHNNKRQREKPLNNCYHSMQLAVSVVYIWLSYFNSSSSMNERGGAGGRGIFSIRFPKSRANMQCEYFFVAVRVLFGKVLARASTFGLCEYFCNTQHRQVESGCLVYLT